MILGIVAVILIVIAVAPPDVLSITSGAKALWNYFWPGVVRVSTAPFSDWQAAIERFILVVGAILLVASFFGPLPASTEHGRAADLKQAVIAFQTEHGLTPDGIIGQLTVNAYRKGD